MKPRDQRALWLLGGWLVLLGAGTVGQKLWDRHRQIQLGRSALAAQEARALRLRQSLEVLQAQRREVLRSQPPAWLGLPEDQFRMRIQDALLGEAQRAGLQEVRLRQVSSPESVPVWRVEGQGTLAQWVTFVEAMGKVALPLDLGMVRWGVQGDPWNPAGGEGSEGPGLKGEMDWRGLNLPIQGTDGAPKGRGNLTAQPPV